MCRVPASALMVVAVLTTTAPAATAGPAPSGQGDRAQLQEKIDVLNGRIREIEGRETTTARAQAYLRRLANDDGIFVIRSRDFDGYVPLPADQLEELVRNVLFVADTTNQDDTVPLAAALAKIEESSTRHKNWIRTNHLPILDRRLADLVRQREALQQELERLLDAFSGPGSEVTPPTAGTPTNLPVRPGASRTCVEFVGVSTVSALAESAEVTGTIHRLRNRWPSPRGWQGDVTLEWTAPPQTVCDGDEVTFVNTVTNHRPFSGDPGGTAGHLDFKPTSFATIACTNPDRWDPPSDVVLPVTQAAASNRCTARVKVVGFYTPAPLFLANLGAGSTGIVSYNYRRVDR